MIWILSKNRSDFKVNILDDSRLFFLSRIVKNESRELTKVGVTNWPKWKFAKVANWPVANLSSRELSITRVKMNTSYENGSYQVIQAWKLHSPYSPWRVKFSEWNFWQVLNLKHWQDCWTWSLPIEIIKFCSFWIETRLDIESRFET